jgi:hypothetical protein
MSSLVSTWKDVAAAEAAFLDGGPGTDSCAAQRDFLKLTREHACRKPALVARCGAAVLRGAGLPESERWQVHEQLVVACLDSGDAAGAEAALKPLQQRRQQQHHREAMASQAASLRSGLGRRRVRGWP